MTDDASSHHPFEFGHFLIHKDPPCAHALPVDAIPSSSSLSFLYFFANEEEPLGGASRRRYVAPKRPSRFLSLKPSLAHACIATALESLFSCSCPLFFCPVCTPASVSSAATDSRVQVQSALSLVCFLARINLCFALMRHCMFCMSCSEFLILAVAAILPAHVLFRIKEVPVCLGLTGARNNPPAF